MYQRAGGSKLLADSGVEAASTCRAVPVGLVPRLFLIGESAWQHWGVGAVYFRYVMIHVIYSDHAIFLKIIL